DDLRRRRRRRKRQRLQRLHGAVAEDLRVVAGSRRFAASPGRRRIPRHVDDAPPLRAADLAGGPARRLGGPRLPDPRRDARGPRAAPADRHRPADHRGDLPAHGRDRTRRRAAPPADPARVLAAPHGLPRHDHDRLGHVHALLHGRRPLARAPRLPAAAVPERPRLEPELRGGGGAARRRRVPGGARRGGVLPLRPPLARADRGAARLRPRRDGARLRARDVDLPRDRPVRRGHVQGGRRTGVSGRRAREDGLGGRAPEADAVVVGVLADGRAGRRHEGDGREGQRAARARGRGGRRVRPRAQGEAAPGTPRTAGDGRLIPLVRVAGDHRELGRQLGEATAETVRRAASEPFDAAVVRRYRSVTERHLPWLVEELDGVAEGAGADALAVFAASIEELASTAAAATGCTDLVAAPAATADGHLLVAHNNDLDAADEADVVAIEWRVPGEPVCFTLGLGPWISVGWNDGGLSLTGNELSPGDEQVGIPRLLQVRDVLTRCTIDGAVEAVL